MIKEHRQRLAVRVTKYDTPDRTPETVALQKLTKFVLFAGEERVARGLPQKDGKSFGQKAVILRIYCGRPAFLRRKSGQKAVGWERL